MKEEVRIVAIDPGARWTGITVLAFKKTQWILSMGLVERVNTALTPLVEVIARFRANLIIMEAFRHRPVMHQSYDPGETLQLIGAIKYIHEMHGTPTIEVPTADPSTLTRYPIWEVLERWADPLRTNPHVKSSWRVMMSGLQRRYPDRVVDLINFIETPMKLEPTHHGFEPQLTTEMRLSTPQHGVLFRARRNSASH